MLNKNKKEIPNQHVNKNSGNHYVKERDRNHQI